MSTLPVFNRGDMVRPKDEPGKRYILTDVVMRDEQIARLCKRNVFTGHGRAAGDWVGDWRLSDIVHAA